MSGPNLVFEITGVTVAGVFTASHTILFWILKDLRDRVMRLEDCLLGTPVKKSEGGK